VRSLLRFFPYVWRTIKRARLRTSLAVLGAALAMALFAFVRTVDRGVEALAEESDRPVLVVFQDSRFCPLTSYLPARYAPSIRDVEGVDEVLPTLVFINSCRANLDLVTLHGVEPDRLDKIYDLDFVDGSLADWRGRSDGAVVGKRLAERRGLSVGSRAVLGNIDLHVSAIATGPTPGLDNLAFVHLDQLSLARDSLGAATQFMVRLEEGADEAAVSAAIDERFRDDEARTDTKTMQAFVAGAVGEIAEVVAFGRVLGYIAVVVVALVLANTVYISAQARTAEMGVLETIGVTRAHLFGLLSLEGIGLGLLGGILGAGAVMAVLAVNPITLGVEGHGIDFVPSWRVSVEALVASLVVGAAAAVGPALAIVRRPLSRAVRGE